MPGQFFHRIFTNAPKSFATITEVDEFLKEKNGAPLEIKYVHRDLCSSRGSVFGIKTLGDADKRFDKALPNLDKPEPKG